MRGELSPTLRGNLLCKPVLASPFAIVVAVRNRGRHSQSWSPFAILVAIRNRGRRSQSWSNRSKFSRPCQEFNRAQALPLQQPLCLRAVAARIDDLDDVHAGLPLGRLDAQLAALIDLSLVL